ncbi:MAG: hypothetical protein QOD75_2525 [Blastocatellia bacterium]|nr:hypothetical protein [Blastocatellia bacterium]
MQIEILTGAFRPRPIVHVLPACVFAMFCCGHAAIAQSGRQPPPPPPPPVTVTPDTSELPFKISSVIVSGRLVYEEGKIHSNDVERTIEECIERLNQRPLLTPIKGGKMTKEQAIARAKSEENSYVLWMEITMKDRNVWGELDVSHIDYYLFRPRTAKLQAEGRVDPNNIVKRIGGAQVPIENRRIVNRRPQTLSTQLHVGAYEVADLVRGRF